MSYDPPNENEVSEEQVAHTPVKKTKNTNFAKKRGRGYTKYRFTKKWRNRRNRRNKLAKAQRRRTRR